MSYGQYCLVSPKDMDPALGLFRMGHNILPNYNPMSTLNMALRSMPLTHMDPRNYWVGPSPTPGSIKTVEPPILDSHTPAVWSTKPEGGSTFWICPGVWVWKRLRWIGCVTLGISRPRLEGFFSWTPKQNPTLRGRLTQTSGRIQHIVGPFILNSTTPIT